MFAECAIFASFLFQFHIVHVTTSYDGKKRSSPSSSIDTLRNDWRVCVRGRCGIKTFTAYRSVMEALRMGLSSMALGATNSGKTETLKDLTKAVGKKGVVYNCNRTLDCIVLGKFFKVCNIMSMSNSNRHFSIRHLHNHFILLALSIFTCFISTSSSREK